MVRHVLAPSANLSTPRPPHGDAKAAQTSRGRRPTGRRAPCSLRHALSLSCGSRRGRRGSGRRLSCGAGVPPDTSTFRGRSSYLRVPPQESKTRALHTHIGAPHSALSRSLQEQGPREASRLSLKSGRFRLCSPKFCQTWAELGRSWSESSRTWWNLGQADRSRPNVVWNPPNLTSFGADLGPTTKLAQLNRI